MIHMPLPRSKVKAAPHTSMSTSYSHAASLVTSAAPRPRWQRHALWILTALALACATKFLLHLLLPRNFNARGEMITLSLQGGPQKVPFYCRTESPKGIVILGTGDGGWSYWEENTAQHLATAGYAVGGWDCRKFADSRTYDHAQLCAGYRAALDAVRERSHAAEDVPIWYAGWSTGAEQAVAAATDASRPAHLSGLLLAAPGERGRYGITTSDLLGKTPQGPNTFALADLGKELRGLPVAQFSAGLDPLDNTSWLDHYTGPKKIIHMSGMLHDMGGAGPAFQSKLDEALSWTLNPRS